MSKAQVARDLGIRDNLLSKWQKQLQSQGVKAFPGHGNPTEQELVRLRRENEVLRREREILKKAVSIFSQQQL
jgi:transposase